QAPLTTIVGHLKEENQDIANNVDTHIDTTIAGLETLSPVCSTSAPDLRDDKKLDQRNPCSSQLAIFLQMVQAQQLVPPIEGTLPAQLRRRGATIDDWRTRLSGPQLDAMKVNSALDDLLAANAAIATARLNAIFGSADAAISNASQSTRK